jgi:hypothetical protein
MGPFKENRGMSASEIRATLMDVARERLQAECAEPGLRVSVLTAVTQLAVLRGQLYGRQLG